jgi:hypothetical protein
VPPFLHENGKKILKWDAQRVLFWPTSPHAKWRQLKALGLLSSQRDAFTIFLVSVGGWLKTNFSVRDLVFMWDRPGHFSTSASLKTPHQT